MVAYRIKRLFSVAIRRRHQDRFDRRQCWMAMNENLSTIIACASRSRRPGSGLLPRKWSRPLRPVCSSSGAAAVFGSGVRRSRRAYRCRPSRVPRSPCGTTGISAVDVYCAGIKLRISASLAMSRFRWKRHIVGPGAEAHTGLLPSMTSTGRTSAMGLDDVRAPAHVSR